MGVRVTAVVVDYDSAPDLYDCLDALRAQDHPVDLVVVDNGSTDGSPDVVRAMDDVTLIEAGTNLGFGAAVNLAVETLEPEGALLLVNPDAFLAPDAVARMVETLTGHEGCAAVGPMVRNPDGSIQPSKRSFPTWSQAAAHATVGVFWPDNPATRAYVCADVPDDEPTAVGWLSASVLLLRVEVFRAVGMFDPRFFFYVEDLDLCRRLADARHDMLYEPRAVATHAWGGSTRNPVRQLWQHHSNLFRYWRKYQRGWRVVTYPAVIVGLALRFALLWLRIRLLGKRLPAHHRTRPGRDTAPRP